MTPRRYELTDFRWSIIEPLLPNKPRGVPRADDRRVLNGIYWRLRTGHHGPTSQSGMVAGRGRTQPLRSLAEDGCLGQGVRCCFARL